MAMHGFRRAKVFLTSRHKQSSVILGSRVSRCIAVASEDKRLCNECLPFFFYVASPPTSTFGHDVSTVLGCSFGQLSGCIPSQPLAHPLSTLWDIGQIVDAVPMLCQCCSTKPKHWSLVAC